MINETSKITTQDQGLVNRRCTVKLQIDVDDAKHLNPFCPLILINARVELLQYPFFFFCEVFYAFQRSFRSSRCNPTIQVPRAHFFIDLPVSRQQAYFSILIFLLFLQAVSFRRHSVAQIFPSEPQTGLLLFRQSCLIHSQVCVFPSRITQ